MLLYCDIRAKSHLSFQDFGTTVFAFFVFTSCTIVARDFWFSNVSIRSSVVEAFAEMTKHECIESTDKILNILDKCSWCITYELLHEKKLVPTYSIDTRRHDERQYFRCLLSLLIYGVNGFACRLPPRDHTVNES